MIKWGKVLSVMRDRVPPEEAQATEIVLENSVVQQDALLHIGSITDYVLTLGKRSLFKFYNFDKLRADNIYVHQRPYGGSGTLYGPNDAVLSLYVNKASFSAGFDVDAVCAYILFTNAICSALNDMGLVCRIDDTEKLRKEDGVCAHLHGRSEILSKDGTKLVASVFREDDLGFYMRALILVSDDWAKIYDYLVAPTKPLTPVDSVQQQLNRPVSPEEVVNAVVNRMVRPFSDQKPATINDAPREIVKGLKNRYRVV